LRLEEPWHAEPRFRIAQGRRLADNQQTQGTRLLGSADLQRTGHPGLGLTDISRAEGGIGPEHPVSGLQPEGRRSVFSGKPQPELDGEQRKHRGQQRQGPEEPEPPGTRDGTAIHRGR